MTRKMLIISNPGELRAENYCEGVNKDVENYIHFFTSALGGGWLDGEIKHLYRPYPEQVTNELQAIRNADYSMVIFCGHGYSCEGETIVQLRKGYDYRSSSFRSFANKRTIILDCCRVIAKAIPSELYEMAHSYFQKRSMDNITARLFYNELLKRCPDGLVVMNACSLGETAGDDEEQGGYYSHSLVETAEKWFATQTGFQKSCLTVVSAHNGATERVRFISGGKQNPTIEKPRSIPYYPFAIVV